MYSSSFKQTSLVIFKACSFLDYTFLNSQEKRLISYLRMVGIKLLSSESIDVVVLIITEISFQDLMLIPLYFIVL